MLRKILNHLDPGYHVVQIKESRMDTPNLKDAYHVLMTQVESTLYAVSPVFLVESLGVPPINATNIVLVSFPTVVGVMFSYGRRREALSSMKNGLVTVYQKSKAAKHFLAQKLGFKKQKENWVNILYPESFE